MTLALSALAGRVGFSGTMAVDDRMHELIAAGKDIVSLGAGQLDCDTPEPIAEAGQRAIAEGKTRYTPVAGTTALRGAVREKFARENALRYGEDQVIVGAGAKSVIYHALLALVNPGDAVLIPTPAWPSYAAMVTLVGGRAVPVPLVRDRGFALEAEALRGAIAAAGGRARGLVLNSPHNPTGAVETRGSFAPIAAIAEAENLWVISDEIYEHLTYDGPFASFAALPGMTERTLTVNGVSKAFAMTGWRIGYGGGPAELIAAMESLQSHTSGNPNSIAQHAAAVALTLALEPAGAIATWRAALREELRARRDLVCQALAGIPDVGVTRPAGAFYVFADVSRYFGRTLGGRVVRGSSDLATLLLEQGGVAAVPGVAFGDDRSIRVSFAASRDTLREALARVRRALA